MAIVAIIPARFLSTRLPGKPLSDIHGKPMIQHVHERVSRATGIDRIVVATDDERIASAVRSFGGEAVMTAASHATGTDRLAEAVLGMRDADVVVNVQGDEPMIDHLAIDAVIAPFASDPSLPMATVSLPLTRASEMRSPHVVKVVSDARGRALYFSRSPIPHVRAEDGRDPAEEAVRLGIARRHLGLYAYRRDALLLFASWPPGPLEAAEGLEQLRALHNGMAIQVEEIDGDGGIAVDTADDLARVREVLARGHRA